MVATVAGIHVGTDTHSNRPAGNAVPDGSLYSCSTHGLIYKSNYAGNSWATWATLGGSGDVATDAIWDAAGDLAVGSGANTAAKLTKGSDGDVLTMVSGDVAWDAPAAGGLADQGEFTYLDATEDDAPGTPGAGMVRIYAKADGRLYSKDDAGVESGPFSAAGAGGGPLLYVDSLALGATGDEFADMSGWTQTGSPSDTDEADLLTYDATARLITSGRSPLCYWTKSAPDANMTAYLTVYGAKSDAGQMIGFGYINADGDGVGIAYRASTWWHILIDNYAYAGTSAQVGRVPQGWNTVSPYNGAPIVLRLVRAGGNIAVAYSEDGGVTWTAVASSAEPAAGAKRFIIAEFYENGPNPILVGRLTVV